MLRPTDILSFDADGTRHVYKCVLYLILNSFADNTQIERTNNENCLFNVSNKIKELNQA